MNEIKNDELVCCVCKKELKIERFGGEAFTPGRGGYAHVGCWPNFVPKKDSIK